MKKTKKINPEHMFKNAYECDNFLILRCNIKNYKRTVALFDLDKIEKIIEYIENIT